MKYSDLKRLLDEKVEKFNRPFFIEDDPISIPHRFSLKQDIEISGFFASILAWGNRKSIINNCRRLMHLMDDRPYDFVTGHSPFELKKLEKFFQAGFNSFVTLIGLEQKFK